jgi:hypothetical protein
MAKDGGKVRYAMGLFEDAPSLKRAAAALVSVGIEPPSLCVAGERATIETSGAIDWAGDGHSPRIISLEDEHTVLGIVADSEPLWSLDTPLASAIGSHARGLIHSADIWGSIVPHLARGAMLLIAQAPSAALQDEAMRIFLRYSRYPVHAEEFIRLL